MQCLITLQKKVLCSSIYMYFDWGPEIFNTKYTADSGSKCTGYFKAIDSEFDFAYLLTPSSSNRQT
jgi:hypothetical protein